QYIDYNKLSYGKTINKIYEIIDYFIASKPKSFYGIIGISIAIPGAVNKDSEILLAPNLEWKNIHIKKEIEERYNLPVIIENEANAGAYGERKYGVGKKHNHIIYVSIGIGIGVGMIL